MFGLTTLGVVHTAISLVAVAAGVICLVRDKAIVAGSPLGKTYIWTTVLTCLTGLPIFQHGGFGPPHVLAILTLGMLGVAGLAGRGATFGRLSPYVETVAYSATFFFHMIPGATETFTRLPAGAPLFTGPDDPALQKVIGVIFVLFLIGVGWQVWRLRAGRGAAGVRSSA